MLEQDPNLSPIGRDDNGRFARGNAGGPGNPHARHCARVLAFFRNVIDDEKIEAIIHVLYARAVAGDMSAIKLILSYKIGKPAPAPNPDGIERDEWNRLEEAAVKHQAVDDLLHSLPSPLANDLVRTTWQVTAGAFADKLSRQLMPEGMVAVPAARAEETNEQTAADGEIQPAVQEQSRKAVTNSAKKRSPIANGNSTTPHDGSETAPSSPATNHSPRATNASPTTPSSPIANGNSEAHGRRTTKRSRLAKEWLEPIVRQVHGKKKGRKRTPARS